jgi:hypothetical protein
MTAAHWIAIAAIISAAASSWGQFWLKARSEKRALATASTLTIQPKTVRGVVKHRWRWLIWVVNWLATAVSLITFQIAWKLNPTSVGLWALIAICVVLIVCVHILPWVVRSNSD